MKLQLIFKKYVKVYFEISYITEHTSITVKIVGVFIILCVWNFNFNINCINGKAAKKSMLFMF
jgi:hypothetical protein